MACCVQKQQQRSHKITIFLLVLGCQNLGDLQEFVTSINLWPSQSNLKMRGLQRSSCMCLLSNKIRGPVALSRRQQQKNSQQQQQQQRQQQRQRQRQRQRQPQQQQQQQQPTTNNQQPTTNNQQPTTNNQQPTTNNQQPTTNNQQPTTNNQQPTTNHQQPTTNNQQPTTNNQQPTTNNQQPTTNNQPPTTNNQQPTANSQQQRNNGTTSTWTANKMWPAQDMKLQILLVSSWWPYSKSCGTLAMEEHESSAQHAWKTSNFLKWWWRSNGFLLFVTIGYLEYFRVPTPLGSTDPLFCCMLSLLKWNLQALGCSK